MTYGYDADLHHTAWPDHRLVRAHVSRPCPIPLRHVSARRPTSTATTAFHRFDEFGRPSAGLRSLRGGRQHARHRATVQPAGQPTLPAGLGTRTEPPRRPAPGRPHRDGHLHRRPGARRSRPRRTSSATQARDRDRGRHERSAAAWSSTPAGGSPRGQPVFATGPATAFVAVPPLRETTGASYDILGRAAARGHPRRRRLHARLRVRRRSTASTRLQQAGHGRERQVQTEFISVREQILGVRAAPTPRRRAAHAAHPYGYDPLEQLLAVVDAKENLTTADVRHAGADDRWRAPTPGAPSTATTCRATSRRERDRRTCAPRAQLIRYQYDFNRLAAIATRTASDVTYTYGAPGRRRQPRRARRHRAPTSRGPRSASTASWARSCRRATRLTTDTGNPGRLQHDLYRYDTSAGCSR